MNKRIIAYLILALITSFLFYFSTGDILFTLLNLIISIIALCFIERRIYNYYVNLNRTQQCIQFINNFIITLSINKSVLSTYEVCRESFDKDLGNQDRLIEKLNVEEKINYLSKYFNCSIYDVFLKLLDQYIYNGGDILKISQILLFDVRQLEEDIDSQTAFNIKKLFEFSVLWLITFAILIIMKFSLGNYYTLISELNYFKYGILMFFIFFYVNTIIFIYFAYNIGFIKKSNNDKRKKKEKINVKIKKSNAPSK